MSLVLLFRGGAVGQWTRGAQTRTVRSRQPTRTARAAQARTVAVKPRRRDAR